MTKGASTTSATANVTSSAASVAPLQLKRCRCVNTGQVAQHQSSLRVTLEMRCVLERSRDDAGGQPELGVVGERERFVVILDANHRRDRPEDLFARDAHIVASLGKERRREIVTVVLPLE